MSVRHVPFLILLSLATSLSAQTRIDLGVAVGMQSYESYEDDPRVLTGAEILAQHNALGAQVAFEYADLAFIGALYVTHADVFYRHALGRRFLLLVGAGPTYVSLDMHGSEITWNAQADVTWRFRRAEVFARLRQYDYDRSSPGESASPDGPAVSIGMRFKVRG